MLYWAHSALDRDSFPAFSFACIYTEWFRSHNILPNLDFGHLFAGPVRILSTGPKSIGGILTAQKSLCDRTTLILVEIARGEADLVAGAPWPNPQSYKLLSTYRAIITILDNFAADTNPTLTAILGLVESHTDGVYY